MEVGDPSIWDKKQIDDLLLKDTNQRVAVTKNREGSSVLRGSHAR